MPAIVSRASLLYSAKYMLHLAMEYRQVPTAQPMFYGLSESMPVMIRSESRRLMFQRLNDAGAYRRLAARSAE